MGSTEPELLIEMILRQTNYSYDEAKNKLKEYNNDFMKVIREGNGVVKTTDNKTLTINQGIYKELREFMDDASATYRQNQELEQETNASSTISSKVVNEKLENIIEESDNLND